MEASGPSHYALIASPTSYPGQVVRARVTADRGTTEGWIALYVRVYNGGDELQRVLGQRFSKTGAAHDSLWQLPDMGGQPIAEIGLQIASQQRADGSVYLDYLTWSGTPTVTWQAPGEGGTMWQRAWVDGLDQLQFTDEPYRLIQNQGTGLMIQGTREWTDSSVSARLTPLCVRLQVWQLEFRG